MCIHAEHSPIIESPESAANDGSEPSSAASNDEEEAQLAEDLDRKLKIQEQELSEQEEGLKEAETEDVELTPLQQLLKICQQPVSTA